MRIAGSPELWETVRRLAVARVLDGGDAAGVAAVLGVDAASVYRWVRAFRRGGPAALVAAPVPGRPAKLSARQADRALGWVRDGDPRDFGFQAEHWTARRAADVVARRLGVRFNHRYLNAWLARHRVTPQLPQRVPRERDDDAVARWVARDWPAIKRGRPPRARRSSSPTRPGS